MGNDTAQHDEQSHSQKKPWSTPRVIESELKDTAVNVGHGADGGVGAGSTQTS